MTSEQFTQAPLSLHLDRQVCFALYSAARITQQAYRPLLAELDLTYPQYLVLLALWEEDDRTVTALGDALHLDSGTLSPLLRRLESRGYITRSRSEADGRSRRIRLTPRGSDLRDRGSDIQGCLAQAVSMSRDDVDTLRDLAQRLVATTAVAK